MIATLPTTERVTWRPGKPAGGEPGFDVAWVRVDRIFYPPRFRFPLHRHDFGKLFLVERGSGLHHVDEAATPVDAGDLVFVVPNRAHALEATSGRPLVFVNLAVQPALLDDLARRYAADGDWPWSAEPSQPVRLDPEAERSLACRIAALESERDCFDRLGVELVLLESLRLWRERRGAVGALPALVAGAKGLLGDPENLRQGVCALAEQLGCSREHLNRQIRQHLGVTTIELLTRHRLDHAARLMRHGDTTVAAACHACGLDNLSHFYKLFRRQFGCTPASFGGDGAPLAPQRIRGERSSSQPAPQPIAMLSAVGADPSDAQ